MTVTKEELEYYANTMLDQLTYGHFRVKSWKHAWTLLINGYLGV